MLNVCATFVEGTRPIAVPLMYSTPPIVPPTGHGHSLQFTGESLSTIVNSTSPEGTVKFAGEYLRPPVDRVDVDAQVDVAHRTRDRGATGGRGCGDGNHQAESDGQGDERPRDEPDEERSDGDRHRPRAGSWSGDLRGGRPGQSTGGEGLPKPGVQRVAGPRASEEKARIDQDVERVLSDVGPSREEERDPELGREEDRREEAPDEARDAGREPKGEGHPEIAGDDRDDPGEEQGVPGDVTGRNPARPRSRERTRGPRTRRSTSSGWRGR